MLDLLEVNVIKELSKENPRGQTMFGKFQGKNNKIIFLKKFSSDRVEVFVLYLLK